MDYMILTSELPSKLSDMVKKYIEAGWKPQGGIATSEIFGFAQAMVK